MFYCFCTYWASFKIVMLLRGAVAAAEQEILQ